MTSIESCKEQLESLKQKKKEATNNLKETINSKEKERLKNRIRSINQAMRSIREQLKYLDPDYGKSTRKSFGSRKTIDVHRGIGEDFFARSKEVWSDIEGKTWAQIEDEQRENDYTLAGFKRSEIENYMQQACERLTERQVIYINEYFNEGKSFERIAEEYNVDKSTVAKVVKNGIKRIQDWVNARTSIKDFINSQGTLDWKLYLEENKNVISDRQRELLLLVLSRQAKTKQEIADKLNLNQSSVVRTIQAASKTIAKLEINSAFNYTIKIENWETADVFSIALQLDMPLNFYYKHCFNRKDRFNGLTRYVYEVTKRVRAKKKPEEIADEFGISIKTARGLISLIKRKNYIHKINEYKGIPKIFDLLSDIEYVKLQQYVTNHKSKN